MTIRSQELSANLDSIRARIGAAVQGSGRSPDEVTLIVVTKTFNMDLINPILNYGHLDFGENKVQEAKEKWSNVISSMPNINLHMIGNLQSNKAKDAVMLFSYIHTLSSEKLAKILKNEQEKINKEVIL